MTEASLAYTRRVKALVERTTEIKTMEIEYGGRKSDAVEIDGRKSRENSQVISKYLPTCFKKYVGILKSSAGVEEFGSGKLRVRVTDLQRHCDIPWVYY